MESLNRRRSPALLFRVAAVLALAGVLAGCEEVAVLVGLEESNDDTDTTDQADFTANWSDSAYDEVGIATGTETLNLGAADAGRSLFYVVTNASAIDRSVSFPYASPQSSVSTSGIAPSAAITGASGPRAIRGFPGQFDGPPIERAGDIAALDAIEPSALSWNVGDEDTLEASAGELTAEVVATASQDDWSLYVWHRIDGSGGNPVTPVPSEAIDEITSAFLDPANATDIFDLVTGVFGFPWGVSDATNFIAVDRRDIHILLYDIEGDGVPTNGSARTVGYFWAKDNYLATAYGGTPDSNERLMFYLDAALLADTGADSAWDRDDFWPNEVISTLGHEFQHMVHFYQRNVVRGEASEYDTWLNELMSMAAEEVISRSTKIDGPRGVNATTGSAGTGPLYSGRMPEYNRTGATTGLVGWNYSDVLPEYAASYSFGAYLIRAFGFDFFTTLSRSVDPDTVVDYDLEAVARAASTVSGTDITKQELLRRWGVAMFVSDDTDVPAAYRINAGTWFGDGTEGGSVGSLNAYNYRNTVSINGNPVTIDGPFVYRSDQGEQTVRGHSNLFLAGGTVPSGGVSLPFSLPDGVTVTALVW